VKSAASILVPPALCLMILGGVAVEKSTHVKPQDAKGYHAAVAAAIEQIPPTIVGLGKDGTWHGSDSAPTKAAIELLRPNKILSRRYADSSEATRSSSRVCDVLIVQCERAGDMVGHYPRTCYVSAGETLLAARDRDWTVGNTVITGTEYTFERYQRGQPIRRCVYSFLVVPGRGFFRDIKGVNKAAEDYERRHFGAAQFQFLMFADLPVEERDAIFTTLMGNMMHVIDALNDVNLK
jgi:hypothetical protein